MVLIAWLVKVESATLPTGLWFPATVLTSAKRHRWLEGMAQGLSSVREMHRQVGDLKLDEEGVAQCGLLVRYLVR